MAYPLYPIDHLCDARAGGTFSARFTRGVDVGKVLKLMEYSCKDTVSILKALLTLALQGKLRGLVVCYMTDKGVEDTVFTGLYKMRPSAALGVTMKASVDHLRAAGED